MRRVLGVVLAILSVSSCATITRGTDEMFAVETDPPGAIATLSNGRVCKTPCTFKIRRKSDFRVEIVKPGYETYIAIISSSVDGAGQAGLAGNVIFGGLIGVGVDAGSGAMHSHQPNPLIVELTPIAETPETEDVLPISDVQETEQLEKPQ